VGGEAGLPGCNGSGLGSKGSAHQRDTEEVKRGKEAGNQAEELKGKGLHCGDSKKEEGRKERKKERKKEGKTSDRVGGDIDCH